jgi:hypothetical protein
VHFRFVSVLGTETVLALRDTVELRVGKAVQNLFCVISLPRVETTFCEELHYLLIVR